MICNCPICKKAFTIESPGGYSCDACGNSFVAGVNLAGASPQPSVHVSAMTRHDVGRICDTMWICTMWIVFAPIVFSVIVWVVAMIAINITFGKFERDTARSFQQAIEQIK